MTSANAVHSLYGGAVARKRKEAARTAADALCGNIGGLARIQETWTPPWIIDAAREGLGGSIALDPCAASVPSAWFAETNWTLPQAALELESLLREEDDRKERTRLKRALKPHYLGGSLKRHWDVDSSFVNQPFAWLEAWLLKCVEQARRGVKIIQLGPVRPHRPWWRRAVKTGQVVYLRYDVKFQGHRCAFPAPLALVSWNCVVPWLGERETGRE